MENRTTGLKIALLIMLVSFIYVFAVTFLPMPSAGQEHSKTVIGVLIGTIFGTLINYYWGNSSKGQTPPLSPLEETAKAEAAKEDAAKAEAIRIEEAKIKQ